MTGKTIGSALDALLVSMRALHQEAKEKHNLDPKRHPFSAVEKLRIQLEGLEAQRESAFGKRLDDYPIQEKPRVSVPHSPVSRIGSSQSVKAAADRAEERSKLMKQRT